MYNLKFLKLASRAITCCCFIGCGRVENVCEAEQTYQINKDEIIYRMQLMRTFSALSDSIGYNALQIFNIPYSKNFKLGSGVDITGKSAFPSAIKQDFETVDSKTLPMNTAKSFFTSSKTSFDKKMSTSFSAKATAFSCLEASISYSSISDFSNSTEDMTFYQIHLFNGNKKTSIKRPTLTDEALEFYKKNKIVEFTKKYGTHCVSEYSEAGIFIGQAKLSASSIRNYQFTETDVHAKMSGFFGSVSAKYNDKNEITEFSKKYKVETSAFWSGVDFSVPVNTLDGLLFAYDTFTKKANEKNFDYPSVFICTPYINLLPPEAYDDFKNIERLLCDQIEESIYRKIKILLSSLSSQSYMGAAEILVLCPTFRLLPNFLKEIIHEDKMYITYLKEGIKKILETEMLVELDNEKLCNISKKIDEIISKELPPQIIEHGYFIQMVEERNGEIFNNNNGVYTGIVLGGVGVGKTTLINNICGTELKTSGNGVRTTSHIISFPSKCKKFTLVDTPGLDSDKNSSIFNNICNILKRDELNAIFIVVDGSVTPIDIIESFHKVFLSMDEKFPNISEKVVLMLNKYDLVNPNDTNLHSKMENTLNEFIYYKNQFDYIFYGRPCQKSEDPLGYEAYFNDLSQKMLYLMKKRKIYKLICR